MAVLLYFLMMIGVLLVGAVILAITFHHWLSELRRRIEARESERGGS